MDQTSTASWSTPGKWKSIRKFQQKREEKCIDNYLYDIMLPPTSMEVENDHFTKESALRQIHFPLGPAFASSEMCLQSSPFTTPASSKCQSQRSWKCNLLKVVTMTDMAYYFPPKKFSSWPVDHPNSLCSKVKFPLLTFWRTCIPGTVVEICLSFISWPWEKSLTQCSSLCSVPLGQFFHRREDIHRAK